MALSFGSQASSEPFTLIMSPSRPDSFDRKDDGSIEHVEKRSDSIAIVDDYSELLAPERRPAAERRLVRILDCRLLPTIVLVFILNYIDVSITVWDTCHIKTDNIISVQRSQLPD